MIKLTKKLENKYFIDNLEDGYRLFTITAKNCSNSEGIKLSELLIELYSEEISMYLYDYEYCEEDQYFEFQLCIDDAYLKEFNKLYDQFKISVDDLLEAEEDAMLEDN